MQLLAFCSFAPLASATFAQLHVAVDHVGYETKAPKEALLVADEKDAQLDPPQTFSLVDTATGKDVLNGPFKPAGQVDRWGGRAFWIADFSTWQKPGHYTLTAKARSGEISSCEFLIDDNLLERSTLSDVIFYFKGQRASGDIDRADRHLALPDDSGFIDARGGWYDATGDYGIHLSHQNPTSYFNPQQVPLVAWSLLSSFNLLEARHDDNFTEYDKRLLDEGLYGADFLVRIKRPNGSFFESIEGPGRDKLPQDRRIGNPNWRTQIKTNTSDTTEKAGGVAGRYGYEA